MATIKIEDRTLAISDITIVEAGQERPSSTGKSLLCATETMKTIDPRDGKEMKIQVTAYKKA